MREYEIMVILRADMPESENTKTVAKWEGILTAEGGQILNKELWGTRKLAYPIQKQSRGYYILFNVVTTASAVHELDRVMKIDENVLRSMALKLSDNADIEARKAEIKKKKEESSDKDSKPGSSRDSRDRDKGTETKQAPAADAEKEAPPAQ